MVQSSPSVLIMGSERPSDFPTWSLSPPHLAPPFTHPCTSFHPVCPPPTLPLKLAPLTPFPAGRGRFSPRGLMSFVELLCIISQLSFTYTYTFLYKCSNILSLFFNFLILFLFLIFSSSFCCDFYYFF